MARSDRQLLIASPPWPAPMTTVVVRTASALSRATRSGVDLDLDVGRVGDDVVHRRALLRLSDQRLDVVVRGVGVDLVLDLDVAETVADVGVHAEDAAHVHVALDRRL